MDVRFKPAENRFSLLDALRGFAIFGIFGVNMLAASFYDMGDKSTQILGTGEADDIFVIILNTLVEGKFYSIFSLLFGIGFGLQLETHASRGVNGMPVFKRRLWGMLLIGLLHMLFLWVGDIVFLYAWLGFLLILFRHKSDKFLIRTAIFLLALPVLLFPLRFINSNIHLGIPLYAVTMGVGKMLGIDLMTLNPVEMFGAKGMGAYFKANLLAFFYRQADLFDQVRPFKVFAMMLMALWVSRHRWFAQPELFLNAFKKWIPVVLPVSLLINAGMAYLSWNGYYAGNMEGYAKTWLYFLGVVPLSICYIYFFTKAYISGSHHWLHAFTYVGRMALTNYIFQSVLYMILFRGPFLDLIGSVGAMACMIPVVVIFPLQIIASKWWLSKYKFGPLEWLWRSMTYGKWQPMKRDETQS